MNNSTLSILIIVLSFFFEPLMAFERVGANNGCFENIANNSMFVTTTNQLNRTPTGLFTHDSHSITDTQGSARFAGGEINFPICKNYLPADNMVNACSSFVLRGRYLVTNYHCHTLVTGSNPRATPHNVRYGHFRPNMDELCQNFRFVQSQAPLDGPINSEQIFRCNRVLTYAMANRDQLAQYRRAAAAGERVGLAPDEFSTDGDFIIMELDRPVSGAPLQISNTTPAPGSNSFTLGFPMGSGLMLGRGRIVQDPTELPAAPSPEFSLILDLDADIDSAPAAVPEPAPALFNSSETLPGNSGSLLANESCQAIGLHRSKFSADRSTPSFRFNENEGCFRRNSAADLRNLATPISVVNAALDRALNSSTTTTGGADVVTPVGARN